MHIYSAGVSGIIHAPHCIQQAFACKRNAPVDQQVAQQLKDANPQQLLENLNGLSQQGQQALTESMEELKKAVDVLESIDIEALNEAVDNLGRAVSPLARLFGGR